VVIGGQMGSDISVENLIKLSSDEVLAKNQPPSLVDATEFADALNIENPRKNSPPVAPLEVARQIAMKLPSLKQLKQLKQPPLYHRKKALHD